jgi:diketogulonate reductase-like aldo/keto reductase
VFVSSPQNGADKVDYISGYYIPSIGFGTWTLGNGQGPVDQVEQALENGYNHIGESRYLIAAAYVDVNPIAQTLRNPTGMKEKLGLL